MNQNTYGARAIVLGLLFLGAIIALLFPEWLSCLSEKSRHIVPFMP
ncbi:MAG: hypothetical protein AAB871_00450 [Patescibacteria group bacterium]